MFYMKCKKVSGDLLLRAVSRSTVFRAAAKLLDARECLFRVTVDFFVASE